MLVFKSHVWYSVMIHTDSQSDMHSCWLLSMYHLFATVIVSVMDMIYIHTVHIAVEDFMSVLKSSNRFKNPPQGLFG